MAAFPYPEPVNIGGYLWYPVYGTTAGPTYPAAHVYACGGNPERVRNTASTLGYYSEPPAPKRKRFEMPTTKEGKRLLYHLITKYGFGKSYR